MDWKKFWETKARSGGPALQVGRVLGGVVLDEAWMERIAARIAIQLDLQKEDNMLDVCCGNGALSRALLPYCHYMVGVDFSENLINQAQDFELNLATNCVPSPNTDSQKNHSNNHQVNTLTPQTNTSENALGSDRNNEEMNLGKSLMDIGSGAKLDEKIATIKYVCADATNFELGERFDKICLYFSFQYFESVSKGAEVLANLVKHAKPGARILLGDIPDQRKFFVYYNSPRKMSSWLKQSVTGKNDMGKFWHPDELLKISNSLGVKAYVQEQEAWQPYAKYRFDFIIEVEK